MKKSVFKLELAGAIFVIIFGTLLHFTYQWSGNNILVGLFAPVNESVWEHMKLAFNPLLIFGLVEFYFLRGQDKNFFYVKAVELYLVIGLMISSFYTYSGIIGRNFLIVDILTFFVAVIIGKIISYKLLVKEDQKKRSTIIPVFLLLILTAFFFIVTFNPPRIQLFKDSSDNTYGIYKNS